MILQDHFIGYLGAGWLSNISKVNLKDICHIRQYLNMTKHNKHVKHNSYVYCYFVLDYLASIEHENIFIQKMPAYGNIDLVNIGLLMACCLMAPSHYLGKCWLFISYIKGVLMHSPMNNFTSAHDFYLSMEALKGHVKFLKTVCVSPN